MAALVFPSGSPPASKLKTVETTKSVEELQTLQFEREQLLATKNALEQKVNQLQKKQTKLQSNIDHGDQEQTALAEAYRDIEAIDALLSNMPKDQATDLIWTQHLMKDDKFLLASHARELLALAKARIILRWNYVKLFSILLFFILYSIMLMGQRAPAYDIESSVILSQLMGSLPASSGASFLNGGSPGATGSLTTNDDFYTWLNNSLVQNMYKDAVCGDGSCDEPEEVMGIGRFGCAADCGTYPADQKVTMFVNLQSAMLQRFGNSFSLDIYDPGFRYNVFSKKYNDYVFASMMDPSDQTEVQFEALRDDQLELRFFQTNSLVDLVDDQALQTAFHFSGATLPSRDSTLLDWAYGDRREMLAVSQATSRFLHKYCVNRLGSIYSAKLDDDACQDSDVPFPQGFPNYHTTQEMNLQLLTSYGIVGDITVSYLTSDGAEVFISLLAEGDVKIGEAAPPAVHFCSPAGNSKYTLTTGVDFAKYVLKAGATCSASRRSSDEGNATAEDPGFDPVLAMKNKRDVVAAQAAAARLARDPTAVVGPFQIRDFVGEPVFLGNRLGRSLLGYTWTLPLGPPGNLFNLALLDIGVDDKGWWRCFSGSLDPAQNAACYSPDAQYLYNSFDSTDAYGYPGPVFAAVDVSYMCIDNFLLSPNLAAATQKFIEEGAAPPTLGDAQAGLELRYSINDATSATPRCNGTFQAPDGVRGFEYNFKTRLRLYNSNIQKLRVWLCDNAGQPRLDSFIDVTAALQNKSLQPLTPGPSVTLTVPLSEVINVATVSAMQQRLCKVVFGDVDERCSCRVWAVTSKTSAQFTFLTTSNSWSAFFSFLLTKDVQSASFETQFPAFDQSKTMVYTNVYAPWPVAKLTQTDKHGCTSHYDCDAGLFCSARAFTPFSKGFLGSGGPGPFGFGCDPCRYCLNDAADTVDVYCPRDKCGLTSGLFPDCVDGGKIFAPDFKCKDKYTLNMSRIPAVKRTSAPYGVVSLWNVSSTARKARFVTPYNQLVGAVTISQRRRLGMCSIRNDSIGTYTSVKLPILGKICRGKDRDVSPYGGDPAFSPASSMFRGDVSPSQFYRPSEMDSSGPYAFFPYFYDGQTGTNKSSQYIMKGEEDTFKVYFTERLSQVQATRMVQFLQEGGFLDSATDEVTVDILTLNSNLNIFGTFTFTFRWQDGGRVIWDYNILAVPAYLYDDATKSGRIALEYICIAFLVIDFLLEFRQIIDAVKLFRIMEYLQDPFNVVDMCHFGLMAACWGLWFHQINLNDSLKMPSGFALLKSFSVENPARLFLTNADREYLFLSTRKSIGDMAENLKFYTVLASIVVIIFIMRVLKSADFQPRIALVTRTMGNVISDLAHFFVLFVLVLLGYGIAGVALFGNQYEGFATISDAVYYLLIILVAFGPDEGWVQMNHAAPGWAFNIYLWTWFLIGLFILLNIFLAILMNGYSALHDSPDGSADGLIVEIGHILNHEFNKLIKYFFKNHHFVSDEELVLRLSGQISDFHFDDTLKQYNEITLAGRMEIPCKSQPGMAISGKQVLNVLHEYFPEQRTKYPSQTEDLFLNPTLRGIMKRYGYPVAVAPIKAQLALKEHQFLERLQLENARRIAEAGMMGRPSKEEAMAAAAAVSAKSQPPLAPPSVMALRVSVVVEQMRNLPQMDLGRGCDAYAIIFLEDAPGAFQTEVRRGTSQKDWVWGPALSAKFHWEVVNHPHSLRPDRKLVVMVYDKDQFTSDDVVGCATITFGELAEGGSVDGWREIMRPPVLSRFKFRCGKPVPPEVKVRVTLEPILPDDDEVVPQAADAAQGDFMLPPPLSSEWPFCAGGGFAPDLGPAPGSPFKTGESLPTSLPSANPATDPARYMPPVSVERAATPPLSAFDGRPPAAAAPAQLYPSTNGHNLQQYQGGYFPPAHAGQQPTAPAAYNPPAPAARYPPAPAEPAPSGWAANGASVEGSGQDHKKKGQECTQS